MAKVISIRRNISIMGLYENIKGIDTHPLIDRNAIFNRGLDKIILDDADLKEVSKIKIEKPAEDVEIPEFIQINADEKKLNIVLNRVKKTFDLQKVQMPYLVKLVLAYYYTELIKEKKMESLKNENKIKIMYEVEKIVNIGVDGLVFKKEFDLSEYKQKEKLYQLCRRYLEVTNTDMNEILRSQLNTKIKQYSDYFNIDKYFPKRRKTLGTTNIIYITKVLVGLIIVVAEIEDYNLDEIIKNMETDIKVE